MPKTCFILNPIAGPSRRYDMPALIAQHFGALEGSYEIRLTQAAGHAVELARDAAAEGFEVVAAVGGDGTINEVGRGLLGTDAALGIVPQGSGNGLARHLKVPLGLPAALRRLATPDFSRMDVGLMNGHPFFCTAGLGFDAHVSQHFALAGSRGLSTYLRVTLREYRRYLPVPVRVELDGQVEETNCYVLAFANASQYGNNAYIAPLADLRDGLLDVCLIDALPVIRAMKVSLGMALGNLPQSNAADYFRVARGRVTAQSPIGFHVDGDYLGHDTEFVIELLPMALAVAV
ncbi:diacylglycerol kinase family lipid kinase [Hymenobacter sp. BT770]|uniref:diacylglycerol/lipid kinase family protein n=1 Tax=Hymenobacter sp. BT770 TaxID=2886942 RepID=UPI001D1051E9|nr:diacylglycerol kinase family protein [Hymenobacter sp. BT770]MCC3152102.1 diacylglycerol kinase family lipid kinase [Hymenobacter sp. BT770]MDO3415215.1 diacylglycerol kinase family lipid kinase [Hymenobacter sp. BT770]